MWLGKRSGHSNDEKLEWLNCLGSHAGVGLWDAILHEGDPMHAKARWSVSDFLTSMSNSTDERRAYERIDGRGSRARVRIDGGQEFDTSVGDISRSGAALICNRSAAPGTEITVPLLRDTHQIRGRAARSEEGLIAITFLQNAVNLATVDRALEGIGRLTAVAA